MLVDQANMRDSDQRQILISGAGVAGLTAALSFAQKGFHVTVFDKAAALSEVGAGLQLAPNATRILQRLGVIDALRPKAVQPDALYLKDGRNARTLMRMELGQAAQDRWQAPYLACHRADLQAVLVDACRQSANINLALNSNVTAHSSNGDGVEITIDRDGKIETMRGALLVGCDGVWSSRRASANRNDSATFTGHIAWRMTLPRTAIPASFLSRLGNQNAVSAWLGRGVHFIAYPVKSGNFYNFVAITKGRHEPGNEWSIIGDQSQLSAAFSGWHQAVQDVIHASDQWTYWPLFEMQQPRFIENERCVLIGDAAHAMTPFAAQGAAMAIEDAAALATAFDCDDRTRALRRFDTERQRRIKAVAKRGALNRFAYHASGPLALGRDLLFRARSADRFMADLDWLYSYDAEAEFNR